MGNGAIRGLGWGVWCGEVKAIHDYIEGNWGSGYLLFC